MVILRDSLLKLSVALMSVEVSFTSNLSAGLDPLLVLGSYECAFLGFLPFSRIVNHRLNRNNLEKLPYHQMGIRAL